MLIAVAAVIVLAETISVMIIITIILFTAVIISVTSAVIVATVIISAASAVIVAAIIISAAVAVIVAAVIISAAVAVVMRGVKNHAKTLLNTHNAFLQLLDGAAGIAAVSGFYPAGDVFETFFDKAQGFFDFTVIKTAFAYKALNFIEVMEKFIQSFVDVLKSAANLAASQILNSHFYAVKRLHSAFDSLSKTLFTALAAAFFIKAFITHKLTSFLFIERFHVSRSFSYSLNNSVSTISN